MSNHSAGLALTVALLLVSTLSAEAGNGRTINDTSLYAGPEESYRVVGSLASGTDLVIYGCAPDFNWCDVGTMEHRGWAAAEQLAIVTSTSSVPLLDLAPLVGVRVIEYDERTYQARHYGAPGTMPSTEQATAAPAEAASPPVIVATATPPAPAEEASPPVDVANATPVLTEPAAPQGHTELSGTAGEGGPVAPSAAYDRAKGLLAQALQATPPEGESKAPAAEQEVAAIEPASAPSPDVDTTSTNRSVWAGETLSDSSIRSGPASKYPRIATVASGRAVDIFGCTARYRWCDISVGDKRGWVYAPLLAASSGDYLGPLVKVARKAGIPVIKFDLKQYHAQHYAGEPWQNRVGGADVVQLGGQSRNSSGQNVTAGSSAAKATARVIRLPASNGPALPSSASALQPTDAAGTGGTEEATQPQTAGLSRFLPKFLR